MNLDENTLVRHYEGDHPEISTNKGIMRKEFLDRKVVSFEDDNELTHAIEYRLKDGPVDENGECELVHRSVHVQLKKNVAAELVAAPIG